MDAPAATEIEEAALARWLFLESPARVILFPELGIAPTTCSVLSVAEPVIAAGEGPPGDIDVLVIDPAAPELATAIECKRVKVPPVAFDTILPGKLNDLRRGVAQANGLLAMGFHRTFLLVLVITDGRDRNAFNFFFRGLTPELVGAIDSFPDRERLHPEVGLVFVEITQPVDKELALAGGIGVRVRRQPTPRTQPEGLTGRLRELVRRIPLPSTPRQA